MKAKYKQLVVTTEVKNALDNKRLYRRESYNDIIGRLCGITEQTCNPPFIILPNLEQDDEEDMEIPSLDDIETPAELKESIQ
jgi:hypothetical protein